MGLTEGILLRGSVKRMEVEGDWDGEVGMDFETRFVYCGYYC